VETTIYFHGPMLFHIDNAAGKTTVLVPLGENLARKTYPDGTMPLGHYAWLYCVENGQYVIREALTGMLVSGLSASEPFARAVQGYPDLTPLSKIWKVATPGDPTNSADPLNGSGRLAARIELQGGQLGVSGVPNHRSAFDWTFDDTLAGTGQHILTRMAFVLCWKGSLSAPALLSYEENNLRRTLELQGKTVWVTNECSRLPGTWGLAEHQAGSVYFPDDDFKWVYRLFKPPISQWDDEVWPELNGRNLPTPYRRVNPGGTAGRPSTCTGAIVEA
jgi:hypothetical protein